MHGEVVAYSFSGYVYEVEEGAQSCERFSCSERVVKSDCPIFTEGDFPSASEGRGELGSNGYVQRLRTCLALTWPAGTPNAHTHPTAPFNCLSTLSG